MILASVAALPALGGCGNAGAAYLNALCNCEGCSTSTRTTYQQTADDNVEVAAKVGCSAEYSALTTCADDNGVCNGTTYSFGNACDLETSKLENCLTSAKCALLGAPDYAIHCL
jgi:hypothetical protein